MRYFILALLLLPLATQAKQPVCASDTSIYAAKKCKDNQPLGPLVYPQSCHTDGGAFTSDEDLVGYLNFDFSCPAGEVLTGYGWSALNGDNKEDFIFPIQEQQINSVLRKAFWQTGVSFRFRAITQQFAPFTVQLRATCCRLYGAE